MIVLASIALAVLDASGQAFWQGLVINLVLFIILTVSLNLTSGFTGVFSLGQIGFMALGAYISAILTLPLPQKAVVPAEPAVVARGRPPGPGDRVRSRSASWSRRVIAAALVSVVAWLVGRVLMRLSGHFVAVATLGFLVIVRVILFNADSFTRGSRTFSNVTPYTNLWWMAAWALLAVYVVWRIKRSPFGRDMLAQREDRVAAQSLGIRVMDPRLLAFVVGAFFSAAAGSLYAHFITSFSPTVFYFDLTFRVITMLVIGGMGSVSGSILGAILIVGLSEALRRVEDATLLYGAQLDRPGGDLHRGDHRPAGRPARPARGAARPPVRPGLVAAAAGPDAGPVGPPGAAPPGAARSGGASGSHGASGVAPPGAAPEADQSP